MGKKVISVIFLFFICSALFAQQEHHKKIYTMSGVGFAFPVSKTNDIFKPKFSTTLGANVDIGKKGLFLYPQLSFHAYSFFQKEFLTESNKYLTNKTRSTTYFLSLVLGYRKSFGRISLYGFGGVGGGNMLIPHIAIAEDEASAILQNHSFNLLLSNIGAGAEYSLGEITLFFESSWMHSFRQIEHKDFNSIPLCVGIKPSLSKLFKKKK